LENIKNEIAYFEGVVGLLDDSCMARLDFDELRVHLASTCATLASVRDLTEGHALLRQDLEQRIGGMIKAVAAVDRRREQWEEAAALVEQLPHLTPVSLLETYRRVAARFRDHFPGSFGPKSFGGRKA
jgi:hypothetical protein